MIIFISGIDTDIGKTIATGMLARSLMAQNVSVITQKLVQTGVLDLENQGRNGQRAISEDILTHRKLMQIPLNDFDNDGTTCPYCFSKPASPHLAAAMDNAILNVDDITRATNILQNHFDVVLLEGAGGLLVPITEDCLTLDYIAAQGYPVILVTSGRLGSINHTLLSIEAVQSRGLKLQSLIYNAIHDSDADISQSTQDFLQRYLKKHAPDCHWLVLNQVDDSNKVEFNLPTQFIVEVTKDN